MVLTTIDENDEIISRTAVDAHRFEGEEFRTLIAEVEGNKDKLKIFTINEKERVVLEQEIDKKT